MGILNDLYGLSLNVSDGNEKLGSIRNFSLPPIVTCKNCVVCSKYCYAKDSYNRFSDTRKAWDWNLELYKSNPEIFLEDLDFAISLSRMFRFFVSGDVIDERMAISIVESMRKWKKCDGLAFSKNYDLWNKLISNGLELPENFHLVFSHDGINDFDNPHNLPVAHVLLGKDSDPKVDHVCTGHCEYCFCRETGCIALKNGQSVGFPIHGISGKRYQKQNA